MLKEGLKNKKKLVGSLKFCLFVFGGKITEIALNLLNFVADPPRFTSFKTKYQPISLFLNWNQTFMYWDLYTSLIHNIPVCIYLKLTKKHSPQKKN
jgi:hypothetical protein